MILAYDSVYGLMMTRKVNADQLVIFYSHSLEMCSPRDMAYKITYSSGTVKWLNWNLVKRPGGHLSIVVTLPGMIQFWTFLPALQE